MSAFPRDEESPFTVAPLFARTPVRLALWIVLGMWFMGTWLSEPYLMGRGQDWAYFVHHATVATRSWSEYGQMPMWNPWFCGGIPALANIQTDALSPDLLLTLPFDQPIASALRLLLFIVVGLEGAWQYARHHGVRGWGAIIATAAFMFSGRFMMIFWDGHLPFYGFALAPWVFLGLERAYQSLRWGLVAAVALTWIFFYGGAVATPLIVSMMGFLVLRDTIERVLFPTTAESSSPGSAILAGAHSPGSAILAGARSPGSAILAGARSPGSAILAGAPRKEWYRPLAAFAFIGVITLLLSLPRLVPVFQTLIDYPRHWDEPERLSVWHIAGMMFLPPRSWLYFDVGTSYVGLGIGLAFLAALPLRGRAMWRLLAASVMAFDLAMGESGPLHLWKLMHALPVVSDVRAAFRFTFLLALFVSIGAGRAVWWLEQKIALRAATLYAARLQRSVRTRRWRVSLAACAIAGAVAVVVGGHGPIATRQRLTEIPRLEVGPTAPGDFHQALGTRWIAHVWPRANLGSIACFEEQPFAGSASLRGDRTKEEWLVRGKGTVERLGWSPNEIDLTVDAPDGGLVAVNQNAARGWSATGGEIVEYQGLLAAQMPPGRHALTLTYEEPGIIPLMAVSLLTMLGIVGWLGWLGWLVWARAWRPRTNST